MTKNWIAISIDDIIKTNQHKILKDIKIKNNNCKFDDHNIISVKYNPGKNSSFFDSVYGRCDLCGNYFKRALDYEESRSLLNYFKENNIL